MIGFVRENSGQLFGNNAKGKRAPANVEKLKKSCWQRAATVLYESGCKQREWLKVRKRWGELAAKARKYKRNMEKTGKFRYLRPCNNGPLTTWKNLELRKLPFLSKEEIVDFCSAGKNCRK